MAVIQISRIQIRRGQVGQDGLPQLASGEMGWAIDQQELFIGNGSVAEGAPFVGNTRILTENDLTNFNIFSSSVQYTFKGHNTGTTVLTGLDANHPFSRSIQSKLDDEVTVLDFGVVDGNDITTTFQRALDQIYLNSDSNYASSRRPIRVPAGQYTVAGTIYVPPGAVLVGDGIDKTIITTTAAGTTSSIFQTHAGFDGQGARITGLNIQSTNQPTDVHISGMTLGYSTATQIQAAGSALIVLDSVLRGSVRDVKFTGAYGITSEYTTSSYTGVELRGNLTDKVVVERNVFQNVCYPVYSDYDVTDIDIRDNKFKRLSQGVTLAAGVTGASPKQYGPTNVRIINNKFDTIKTQAIYAGYNTGTNTLIQSAYNTFHEVGNNNLGDNNPVSSIIHFGSLGNSSKHDNFERFTYAQTAAGQASKQIPMISGDARVDIDYVKSIILTQNANTQTLFTVPVSTATNVSIDYVVHKTTGNRMGKLKVFSAQDGTAVVRDDFTMSGSIDETTRGVNAYQYLNFSAKLVDNGATGAYNTLLVQYLNPLGAGTGTCVATISTIW